jgi:trigger factor
MEKSVGVQVPLYPHGGREPEEGINTVQVTINTISEVEHEAEFEISGDELQPHFEKAYQEFRPKAQIRGFRKGKVPLPMIKQMYGEAIEQEALDDIANEIYRKAMEERNINPIGRPSMTDMDFKRKEHFRFKIKYEVKPQIALQKYKGILVEKPVHPVTDAEVEAEIQQIRRSNSTTLDAAEVTDTEYVVTADVQELDEAGSPLIGKKTPNARFYLADETLAGEIKTALAHAQMGGTYRATIESEHADHAHKNFLEFTVTRIQKVELPPLDAALVKKVTNDAASTPEGFRADIRNDLEKYWKGQSDARVNDGLANEIVRLHEFPVPESLVDAFQDSFVEEVKNRSKDKKLPKGFDEEKFRTENRAYAIWQAKWMLLKERIAEEEHLSVTDADIEALVEAEAARIGIGKDRLMEYYRKSNATTERILSDKIMSLLRENARITETPLSSEGKNPA